MPKYLIKGFDRESGESVHRYVEAGNEGQAIKAAGIIVESIQLAPERVVQTGGDEMDEPEINPEADFSVMRLAESALAVVATIGMSAGGLVAIGGVMTMIDASGYHSYDTSAESAEGFARLVLGLSCIISSLMLMSLGFVLKALRVIAVNSYGAYR